MLILVFLRSRDMVVTVSQTLLNQWCNHG